MSRTSVRAVLWDADGVLQDTPAGSWHLAVQVVDQFPGALTGAPISEARIRAAAFGLGLGDRAEEILTVWSTFELQGPSLEVVSLVRAAGCKCYLATNQDAYRASRMRKLTPYTELLDGFYFSCEIGAAKPAVAFFGHIVDDLDLAANELLFIDDRLENVLGARSAGLHAEQWEHGDGISRLRLILNDYGTGLSSGSE